MSLQLESAADETARLRRCLNDLVSIMALPAAWTGGEPQQIVSTLLDGLLGMLRLSFVFARLNDPVGGPSVDTVRVAESLGGPGRAKQIGETLDASLGEAPVTWPVSARVFIEGSDLSVASARLGASG